LNTSHRRTKYPLSILTQKLRTIERVTVTVIATTTTEKIKENRTKGKATIVHSLKRGLTTLTVITIIVTTTTTAIQKHRMALRTLKSLNRMARVLKTLTEIVTTIIIILTITTTPISNTLGAKRLNLT
jgi:hypothetical protein